MTSVSPHALFGFGVHPRRWLIQQDDPWVADHTQGETQLKQAGVKMTIRHVSYRQKVPGRQSVLCQVFTFLFSPADSVLACLSR